MSQKWKDGKGKPIPHDHGEPFEKEFDEASETYKDVKPVATVFPLKGENQGQEIPVSKFQAKRLVKMGKAVNTQNEYKAFQKKEEKAGIETKEAKLFKMIK
jgi:hypothetical protein